MQPMETPTRSLLLHWHMTSPDRRQFLVWLPAMATFAMRAACLYDGSEQHDGSEMLNFNSTSTSTDKTATCLFAYDFDLLPSSHSSQFIKLEPGLQSSLPLPFRKVLGGKPSQVQHEGSVNFASFPEHHFFSRIFRPQLVSFSLFLPVARFCVMTMTRMLMIE